MSLFTTKSWPVLAALLVCCSADPMTTIGDLRGAAEDVSENDTVPSDAAALDDLQQGAEIGTDVSAVDNEDVTEEQPDLRGEGSARADQAGVSDSEVDGCEPLASRNGFPGDFPELIDTGGFGEGEILTGFGGYTHGNRACNRERVSRRPIILLHGNGSTATNTSFGVGEINERLREEGYGSAEIWAVSYLGSSVESAETWYPTRNNIDDVRRFVDAVMEYLDVDRVDLVGHSLGAVLINGYLRGLDSDGDFDNDNHRMDAVGTVVMLGSANYGTGTGPMYSEEFDILGRWLRESREFRGVDDDTPYGATDEVEMTAPSLGTLPGLRSFKATSDLDTGRRRIVYVAVWSQNDVVDLSYNNTSGLQGADLNLELRLPMTAHGVLTPTMARHANLVLRPEPFEAFYPYLDR